MQPIIFIALHGSRFSLLPSYLHTSAVSSKYQILAEQPDLPKKDRGIVYLLSVAQDTVLFQFQEVISNYTENKSTAYGGAKRYTSDR